MSDRTKRLNARTRKVPLAIVAVGSAYLYVRGYQHKLPELPAPLDNINEHAAHIGAGAAIGYIGRLICEKIRWLEDRAFAISVAGATALGFMFETDLAELVWYRGTTHDVKDALFTAAASVIGAACIKDDVEIELAEIIETNSLQTD